MKKEQLRKLHMNYLQFYIRHSSYNTAVSGTRVLRGAEGRKCSMQKAELPWEMERLSQVTCGGAGRHHCFTAGEEMGKDGSPSSVRRMLAGSWRF